MFSKITTGTTWLLAAPDSGQGGVGGRDINLLKADTYSHIGVWLRGKPPYSPLNELTVFLFCRINRSLRSSGNQRRLTLMVET
ncbi:hypothetical protein HanIR_Chr15g0771741 [Helianthus annuus]|nr:hypothetical protein HanIR_Chr15g0771741 [Helianthus annuus]